MKTDNISDRPEISFGYLVPAQSSEKFLDFEGGEGLCLGEVGEVCLKYDGIVINYYLIPQVFLH